MDFENAIKTLLETRERLEETTKKFNALRERHEELQKKHDELHSCYVRLHKNMLDGLWGYTIENSIDFNEIKGADKNLIETDNRVGDFYLGAVLGTGQFSTVREVHSLSPTDRSRHKMRNGKVQDQKAVKIISKENALSIDCILSYENEVRCMKEISTHRNIVDFIGVLHGTQNLYILMEGFKHDLFTFREQYKHKIDTNITSLLLKEIMSGVAHLAQHNMVHRDIKPENVLVRVATNNIIVKLCDFGLCKKVGHGSSMSSKDFAGSPGFFAPELLTTPTYDPYKADIFSIGCTAFEMLVSVEHFSKKWMVAYEALKDPKEKGNFYFHIRKALIDAQDEISRRFSGSSDACVRDFVCSILHMQPSLRPAVTDLLRTKWINKANKALACDILLDRNQAYLEQRRFSYIPPRRLTHEEIDAEFAKKTLLPAGVKIPENRLPAITKNAPHGSQRRRSTIKAVQLAEQQNRYASRSALKDNGLGILSLNATERRRESESRRASFLMIESEQKEAQPVSSQESPSLDPSCVPFLSVTGPPENASIVKKHDWSADNGNNPKNRDRDWDDGKGLHVGSEIERSSWGHFTDVDDSESREGNNCGSLNKELQLESTVRHEAQIPDSIPEQCSDTSGNSDHLSEPLQFFLELDSSIQCSEGETDEEGVSTASSPAVSRKPSFGNVAFGIEC